MKRVLCFLILGLLLNLSFSRRAIAQEEQAQVVDVRQTMGTILLAGLIGGVFGLSTLSFYKHPEDNIRNITFGAGTGMILAALYLTMDVAKTPPEKIRGEQSFLIIPHWDEKNRASILASVKF